MERRRIPYQPALDGLRALAVGAVIAYHLGYSWAQGGFLGVDAFFVLSGYLITTLLVAERQDSGRISLTGFWSRRARRLLPALFVMLTAVCLYAANTVPDIQLGALRDDAIASIFYVANWHFISAGQSYFDLFTSPLPLDHLWSLAIEEQFYLLWPLIALGLLRLSRGSTRLLAIATIAGIVVSQIAMTVLYSPANPSRAYYGTEARAHTILIGCLLALILRAAPDLPARAGIALQGFGALALVATVAAFDFGRAGSTYFNGGSLAFAIAVAVVIAAFVAPAGGLRRAFAIPPLRYIGRISYGLYLWHWPVIVFMTADRVGLGGNRLNLARIAVTFAITVASFHLIEQPILHRRPRPAGARVLLPIGLAVVLTSVFVGTAGAKSPAQVIGRITGGVGVCGPAPEFEQRIASRELRNLGGVPGPIPPTADPRRLTVFGDSRACSLLTGLEAAAPEVDATVVDGAMLGCGVVSGAISAKYGMMPRPWAESCSRRVNRKVDRLVAASNPQMVLWLSGWEVNDLEVDGEDLLLGTPEHATLLLDRMERMYRRSIVPGRKLAILTMPEEAPGKYLPNVDPELGPRVAILNDLFRQFAARHPDDVTVIDLARHLCPTGAPCPAVRDGIKPRPLDGIHFTPKGSAWAATWVWPQLLAIWPTPASG